MNTLLRSSLLALLFACTGSAKDYRAEFSEIEKQEKACNCNLYSKYDSLHIEIYSYLEKRLDYEEFEPIRREEENWIIKNSKFNKEFKSALQSDSLTAQDSTAISGGYDVVFIKMRIEQLLAYQNYIEKR